MEIVQYVRWTEPGERERFKNEFIKILKTKGLC